MKECSNRRDAKRFAYHNFIFEISCLLMLKPLLPLFTRTLTVILLLIYEGILTPTQIGEAHAFLDEFLDQAPRNGLLPLIQFGDFQ